MFQLYSGRTVYIDKFAIFAERHHGTNLVEHCMTYGFGLENTGFFGGKHWFGWTKPETITYHRSSLHTLFIGILRNPYDWIMAMYKQSWHISSALKTDLKGFITNEWYSIGGINNEEILEDRNFITKNRYKNIFEMRTTKYKYLIETMPLIATNYILFSYDDLVRYHSRYFSIIKNSFTLKESGRLPKIKIPDPYDVPQEIKQVIDDNLDWNLENSLGFYKRP